jgi:hypothetical protein
MGLRFLFLLAMGVYLVLFQPFENSVWVGLIAIAGGAFWIWFHSSKK